MNVYKTTFWIVAIGLSSLPAVIAIVYPQLIVDQHKEFISAYGGLMTLSVIATLFFPVESHFLKIEKGTLDSKKHVYYNVVPWLAIIYLFDILLVFIIKPEFINSHFSEVRKLISGMIVTVILYGIFGGAYNPIKTKNQ